MCEGARKFYPTRESNWLKNTMYSRKIPPGGTKLLAEDLRIEPNDWRLNPRRDTYDFKGLTHWQGVVG